MLHLSSRNLLIIHGGRTSQNIKSYSEQKMASFIKQTSIKQELKVLEESQTKDPSEEHAKNFTLSDMYALKLDSLEWIRIQIPGESKLARTNH
jgi:hypothetical protein